jgi:hypothetical protein
MNREHPLQVQPSKLFSVFVLLLIIAAIPLTIFLSQRRMAYPQLAAGIPPYLERLEVVTANGGSTEDGGNEWGGHKERIVRTPDGNLYTVIQAPGTGYLTKEWQLFKRMGDNNWQEINSDPAGREPVNLLAGPQNELYIIGWPGGHPMMWTSTDGGIIFTGQAIPGTWVVSNWPYSAASITPSGDIYLLQTVGGTSSHPCCNAPGYFYWAYYNRSTGQWSNTQVIQYDYRDTYAYLLPTDTGQLTVVGAKTGAWENFGYPQPAAAGGFGYVYKAVQAWNTPNVDTTPLTGTIVKEVFSNNGEYINAFQNDAYRDTSGRTHILYTYRDASTGATPSTTGTYTGYQAILDQNGTLVQNVPLTGLYFPNGTRMVQDTTGAYWIVVAGSNGTLEVAQADAANGISLNPFVTLSLGAYNPTGITYLAVSRNGSPVQDFIDGVFPINNGAGWVYYRIRLRTASPGESSRREHRVGWPQPVIDPFRSLDERCCGQSLRRVVGRQPGKEPPLDSRLGLEQQSAGTPGRKRSPGGTLLQTE